MAYPVTFDVQPPKEFDKAQVALRLVILVILLFVVSWPVTIAAYFLLPVMAALAISQNGPQAYLEDAQAGSVKWLRYLMMFYSYAALATDKLATQDPEQIVSLSVRTTGSPTVGSALLRLIFALPHVVFLAVIFIAFIVVWIITAVSIVANETYPDWAAGFMIGYLRWVARVLAYMASLVDEYPPFSFSDGEAPAPATPAQPVS